MVINNHQRIVSSIRRDGVYQNVRTSQNEQLFSHHVNRKYECDNYQIKKSWKFKKKVDGLFRTAGFSAWFQGQVREYTHLKGYSQRHVHEQLVKKRFHIASASNFKMVDSTHTQQWSKLDYSIGFSLRKTALKFVHSVIFISLLVGYKISAENNLNFTVFFKVTRL